MNERSVDERKIYNEIKKLTAGGNKQALAYKLLNLIRAGDGEQFKIWLERFLLANKKEHQNSVNVICDIISKYDLNSLENLQLIGHAVVLGLIHSQEGGERNE